MDLIALLAIGVLGVSLKRFGWSRPAFLIGFVLAPQAEGYLNLAVQFYGWRMLARPGVLSILAIIVISVWLGFRGRAGGAQFMVNEAASASPIMRRGPQRLFLGGAIAVLLYAVWSSLDLSPLGRLFPISVAMVTLGLCVYLLQALTLGSPEHDANVDLEHAVDDDREQGGLWRNVAWFGAMVLATAVLGFVAGTLAFFVAFLRFRAHSPWPQVAALSSGALAFLLVVTNALLVELPESLVLFYLSRP